MSFKRSFIFSSFFVLLLTTSCSTITNIIPHEEVATNALSGRAGQNGKILVVKIDDTNNARPQIGLEEADIVYIEQVEGGLTRLAAVFSSKIPALIGPVRSARISDIDIMRQFGRVAFAYSGAQRKLLPVIASANLQDLGAQRQSSKIYTTDPNRNPPFAMVLRADLLMERIVAQQFQIDIANSVGFVFGPLQEGGSETKKVEINWPAARYLAIWSETEKRWLLSHNGEENVAQSGLILGPTTLVIQLVKISDSEYGDKFGGITPLSETVGTGDAYVLRDGKAFLTTWSRPTPESGTTFTFADGVLANFAPGQVWVALTDKAPIFTSPVKPQAK